MQRRVRCILTVALSLLPAVLSAAALTEDDIIKLAQSGLADDIILSQIEATRSTFDLSVDEIIELKKAGVSEKVIKAMIESGVEAKVEARHQAERPPHRELEEHSYYYYYPAPVYAYPVPVYSSWPSCFVISYSFGHRPSYPTHYPYYGSYSRGWARYGRGRAVSGGIRGIWTRRSMR